jgi:cytochrome o ubiquinol oxidase subunit 2
MAFDLHAVTGEQFAAWVASTRESGPILDDVAYRRLLLQTRDIAPYTYREVKDSLFHDIVSQKLPPGEGAAAPAVAAVARPQAMSAGTEH